MTKEQLKFTGKIISIGKVQQITEKFKKQEFVISDENEKYPQKVQFECQQGKCDLLNNYKEGDMISVCFNLYGKQWTDKNGVVKTFNTLSVWSMASTKNEIASTESVVVEDTGNVTESGNEDLPF